MSKKVLGRGLRALIPGPASSGSPPAALQTIESVEPLRMSGGPLVGDGVSTELEVDRIVRNPNQPRRIFDSDAMESLANSIKIHGVLQPILVRPLQNGTYEIVAGERRWMAAQKAGAERIPAHIRSIPDGALLETALVENIQRADLSPIEEAEAYKRLTEEMHLSQVEIALRVGRDRSSVSNCLRLLSLPQETKQLVARGALSEGHGRALLQLGDNDGIDRLARVAVEQNLSVRDVEAEVRKALGIVSSKAEGADKERRRGRKSKEDHTVDRTDPMVRSIQDRLTTRLATKVRLNLREGGVGEIVIEFYSPDELSRISELICE